MALRTVHVYVYLPGEAKPVLAGIMTSFYTGSEDQIEEAQALFRYAASYLSRRDAVSIDPFNLPLRGERFETNKDELLLSFGAMRDAAPDSWGRARMEREAGHRLDDIEFILASGEDRSGFLAFSPDDQGPRITAPWVKSGEFDPTRLLDMDGLALHVKDASNIRLTPEEQRLLLVFGSSLGGARPKATIKLDGRIWLAKSPRADDQYNYPRGEHAAMTLAGLCGMRVPETRVVKVMDRDVYLIERFDREATESGHISRHGFLSALSSFGISDNAMTIKQEASYKKLLEKVGEISEAYARDDKKELFRRVAFNILVSNTDDHPRNHGFLFRDGVWRLSPLYDVQPLIYRRGSTRHLAMRFGEHGSEGTISNLLSGAPDFGLSREEAVRELIALLRGFASWRDVFKKAGVPEADMPGYEATFSLSEDWEQELKSTHEFETLFLEELRGGGHEHATREPPEDVQAGGGDTPRGNIMRTGNRMEGASALMPRNVTSAMDRGRPASFGAEAAEKRVPCGHCSAGRRCAGIGRCQCETCRSGGR